MVKYSCELCGKQFNQKGHYTNHLNKKNPCIEKSNIKEMVDKMVEEKMNNLILDGIKNKSNKNNLGQYFTTNLILKEKVFEFILNNPSIILEPCIGQGDLITFISEKMVNVEFDMYEIDKNIKLLESVEKEKIIYGDFIDQPIDKLYKTIIGNPPYVRTKKGNLYIDFTEKCFNLLENDGELIFIVPSDFLKLTNSSKLLNLMMNEGTFTHIYHPNNEKMFENASIDIIIFRYCKNKLIEKKVLYNNKITYLNNTNGLITFDQKFNNKTLLFQDYFDIYVGLVSAKEDVFKNNRLGNINVINGENKIEKYIFINNYPSENLEINNYLLEHKDKLIQRKIKKFNENNWFEWGAPRNISIIHENKGKECIYIHTLSRKDNIAFKGNVNYFGGGLIMLIPKLNFIEKKINLKDIVDFLNSHDFKSNFIFSGRFKIGHRQISNLYF